MTAAADAGVRIPPCDCDYCRRCCHAAREDRSKVAAGEIRYHIPGHLAAVVLRCPDCRVSDRKFLICDLHRAVEEQPTSRLYTTTSYSRARHTRQRAFLAALAEHRTVRAASRETGISTTVLYQWRRRDPDFAAAWEHAKRSSEAQAHYDAARARVRTLHGDRR